MEFYCFIFYCDTENIKTIFGSNFRILRPSDEEIWTLFRVLQEKSIFNKGYDQIMHLQKSNGIVG